MEYLTSGVISIHGEKMDNNYMYREEGGPVISGSLVYCFPVMAWQQN